MKSFWMLGSLLLLAMPMWANDHWPRFRGPNGTGVGEAKIPAEWTDKNRVWSTMLPGQGHGSPVVWGSKIFLQSADHKGKKRLVVCIDADQGKVLWSKSFDAATHKTHRFNSHASSTPAVDAQHVYACWGTPKQLTVVALSHDGQAVWQRGLGKVKGGHGFGASPIVHNGMVLLNNDQDGDSSLIALETATGKTRWAVPRKSLRLTYATPCVWKPLTGGAEQLIFTNWQHGVTALDPATGKLLWENRLFGKDKERAIGSPIVAGDLIIGTCGFVTNDKHLVALRPGQVADGKAALAWRTSKHVPHIPTPLLYQGRLYLWSDQGILTCADPATGKVLYQQRIPEVSDRFFSSPVATNGKIFCVSDGGSVVVIAAADQFKLLAVNELDQTFRSTPAIAGGAMYLRSVNQLMCIGKR